MTRFFNHSITSFSTGEMSPKLYGRTDLNQYKTGAKTVNNFTILPHGGLTRRMGTEYLAPTKTTGDKIRLIPFTVSDDTAYMLELGSGYMRFYTNKGQVISSQEINNGDFALGSVGWGDNSSGTGGISFTSGVMNLTGGASGAGVGYQGIRVGTSQYTITATTSGTLNYRIGSDVGLSEYGSGTIAGVDQTISFTRPAAGIVNIEFENTANTNVTLDNVSIDNPIYQIDTPWALADIYTLDYAQSADIMILTHPDYHQKQLVRFGTNDWEISDYGLSDGPYYTTVDADWGAIRTGIDMSYPAINGGASGTVTASSAIFASTDVGRLMRLRASTTDDWSWGTITAFTDSTNVTWRNDKTLALNVGTNSDEWRLGYFSETTGHPAKVTFYEQRLIFANTASNPQTIWGSEGGNIDGFAEDDGTKDEVIQDTSAYVFTIASTKTNPIRWLSPRQQMFIGTTGQTYVMQASSLNEALTPTNVSVKPADDIGSANIRPVEAQNASLFIDQFQSKLFELSFFFEEDSFRSVDLSILGEHLLGQSSVVDMAYQTSPDSVVWVLREDGLLLGLTYLRQQKVVGWHRHEIAGSVGLNGAIVESIATIPGQNQTDLYMVVNRTINGADTRYVEVLRDSFTDSDYKEDIIHLDSSLILDDSKAMTLVTTVAGKLRITVPSHGWLVGDKVYIKNNSSIIDSGTPDTMNRIWTIDVVVDPNIVELNSTSLALSGVQADGTAAKLVTTISGLDHLEGQIVTPYADGAVQTNKTVSSGTITLDTPAAKVALGLHYHSTLQTLELEAQSGQGSSQAARKRIIESTIKFYKTLGGRIGLTAEEGEQILFRNYSDVVNETPALVTGDKHVDFPTGWGRTASLVVVQDQPLPMTITALINKMVISDV